MANNTAHYSWVKPNDGDKQANGKPWGLAIRTFMDGVDSKIYTNSQSILSIQTYIDTLNQLNDNFGLIATVNKLVIDVSANGTQINTNISSINAINFHINTIDGQIGTINATLASLNAGSLGTTISNLQSSVSSLQTLTTTHTNQIGTLNSNVSSITSDLSAIHADITELQSGAGIDLTPINNHLSTIDGQILDITNEMATVNSTLNTYGTHLITIDGEISTLNSTTASHTSSISSLNTTTGEHTTHLGEIDNSITTLNSEVEALQAGSGLAQSNFSYTMSDSVGQVASPKCFTISRIQNLSNNHARVRLYTSQASRDSDLPRDIAVSPSTGIGLILEVLFEIGISDIFTSPIPLADCPSGILYISSDNPTVQLKIYDTILVN